ncbi:universal stress protein [Enterovirga rhinocerotis]|uniref:Universal stress protein family protein n=1 Tax=Enterovirga rhinocerotis TaxID=1339210 RepID=A0A4R7C0C4_9HYPH|nr:universal stress protein [Enterovirga rhinocerotis]TDR89927.1 universal stress protein family protein [Enterovirga rhinocerotis]
MTLAFKSILVGLVPALDGVGAAGPAVRFGAGFAARQQAKLTIHVFVPQLVVPYTVIGDVATSLVGDENRRRREVAAAVGASARQVAGEAGVDAAIDAPDRVFDGLVEHFGRLARVRDVAIFDAGDGVLGSNRHLIEETLFNGGRPIIVVPKEGGNPAPQRVSIAWDGSARSARAVADALPLLKGAQSVSVVVVGGEKDLSKAASGADLLGNLSLHGVAAELVLLEAEGGDVAATLREHVRTAGSELIVMGAFVHSRFRQAVLGGVTNSLLETSPVPLFQSY